MTAAQFAKETSVPVSRTREELAQLLEKHGATERLFMDAPNRAVVGFGMGSRAVRITLPLPSYEDAKTACQGQNRHAFVAATTVEKRQAQLQRQAWRVLLLVVKAKLEAVAGGISTVEQEFLAWTVLPGGQTVGEVVLPQLRTGAPLCLPAPVRP